jgi:hypothetical protein
LLFAAPEAEAEAAEAFKQYFKQYDPATQAAAADGDAAAAAAAEEEPAQTTAQE